MSRSEIGRFVQRVCKEGFTAAAAKKTPYKCTAVLGNEGGDIDSVVCAIYTSYLMNHLNTNNQANEKKGDGGQSSAASFVPVLNFPEEDVPLRGDVLHALSLEGISPSDLVYTLPSASNSSGEEGAAGVLPLSSTKPGGDRDGVVEGVFLVDHNKLNATQAHWGPKVVSVIDHHEDEKLYMETTTGEDSKIRNIVFPCGSCASLVALTFQKLQVEVPSPRLLLAPILLDTMNMDEATKKVTPNDVKAVAFLVGAAGANVAETGGEKKFLANWYDVLAAKKADVKNLTVAQSLRRDYKAFPFELKLQDAEGADKGTKKLSLGLSAVVELKDEFISRIPGGMKEIVAGIAGQNVKGGGNCDIGGILFCAPDPTKGGEIKREMLLAVSTSAAAAAAQQEGGKLTASSAFERFVQDFVQLHLVEEEGGEGGKAQFSSLQISIVEGDSTGGAATTVYQCTQSPTLSRKTLVPEFGKFIGETKFKSE